MRSLRSAVLASAVCAALFPLAASAVGIHVGAYRVEYPSNWAVHHVPDFSGKPNTDIAEFKGGAGFKRTAWAESHDILSFQDGIAILKRYCDADGGYSRYSCPAGKVTREFTTKGGLRGAEITMVLQRQVGLKTERKRFKAYVIHDGKHSGLLIHAVYTEGVTGGNGDIRGIAKKMMDGVTKD
jgi:hypothetical protein